MLPLPFSEVRFPSPLSEFRFPSPLSEVRFPLPLSEVRFSLPLSEVTFWIVPNVEVVPLLLWSVPFAYTGIFKKNSLLA